MQGDDAALVREARRGEESACRRIVDTHSDYLYRTAFLLVANAADAADVLQETFAGAFRGLGGFQGRSSLRTWLTRILVKQAAKLRRSRKRRSAASLDALSDAHGEPSDPRAREAASDVRMDVLAALRTLGDIHREVIVLRELEGLSYEDISVVLEVPRGTVESRLFRARSELRKRLTDYLS